MSTKRDLKIINISDTKYGAVGITIKENVGKANERYATGMVITSPFNNCQIYTIANFASILVDSTPLELLKIIQSTIGKTELLVDIKDVYSTKLENLFNKDEIIFKTPYRNNTGSYMVMYLLQIQNMLLRVEKEELKKAKEEKAAKVKEEVTI